MSKLGGVGWEGINSRGLSPFLRVRPETGNGEDSLVGEAFAAAVGSAAPQRGIQI